MMLEQALEWRRVTHARSLAAHGALAAWRETAIRGGRRRSAAASVAVRRQAAGWAQWRRGLAQVRVRVRVRVRVGVMVRVRVRVRVALTLAVTLTLTRSSMEPIVRSRRRLSLWGVPG